MPHNEQWRSIRLSGTNVLKNLFNERDKSKLDTREQIVTSIALDDLRKNPFKGKFDAAHLKEIHKRIFEAIYPFAGLNRTINLSKVEPVLGGKTVKYGKAEFLDDMLGEYTKPLETFKWDDNNKAASAKVFGQIMTKIWQAHAFREGNTRTTSVFMHQYASERGFDLDRSVTARYPSETRDIFAKATVGDMRDLTNMLVDARETALERNHPTIGRLGEEAGHFLKLMGKPPIAIPAVGENVAARS